MDCSGGKDVSTYRSTTRVSLQSDSGIVPSSWLNAKDLKKTIRLLVKGELSRVEEAKPKCRSKDVQSFQGMKSADTRRYGTGERVDGQITGHGKCNHNR